MEVTKRHPTILFTELVLSNLAKRVGIEYVRSEAMTMLPKAVSEGLLFTRDENAFIQSSVEAEIIERASKLHKHLFAVITELLGEHLAQDIWTKSLVDVKLKLNTKRAKDFEKVEEFVTTFVGRKRER